MNIAFASNVVYPFVKGGAEKRIHEIGTRLATQGHDVTIYARHFWDGPREIDHHGMKLRAVCGARELYSDGRRSIPEAIEYASRLLIPLRRHIESHDVVVASVFPYFPVFASRGASIFTSTPLVTTWHEVWGDYWDEYLGALAPFGKMVERAAGSVRQHPIAVSGTTADKLARLTGSRTEITVVPNGIDTTQVESAPMPNEGYDIVFAGRLIKDKNVDILFQAFDSIAQQYDCTMGIIGDGPERESLTHQLTTLTHSDRVSLLGFLDDYEEVLGHMRSARVFASPSTREGFGITFAEAMAADCIVVAADHPDSAAKEVIGDAGFLCEPTVEGVAAALEKALSGVSRPVSPPERALRFDWDVVSNQALQAYESVV